MILANRKFEKVLWAEGKMLVAGVDEVGRGCFAGPVVAGAVIFGPNTRIPRGIADSKLLTAKERVRLAKKIKKRALCFGIGEINVETINKIGIGKATQKAFVEAIKNLDKNPDHILIDAFYIQELNLSIQQPIKKGDRLSVSIAAASIIAKVYRDNLMKNLGKQFPGYGFAKHKGYGTKYHQSKIKKLGLSPIHRTSFNLTKFL